MRLDGSIGSTLRAFNALEGNELATPDGSLQTNPVHLLLPRNVSNFDVYFAGDQDDHLSYVTGEKLRFTAQAAMISFEATVAAITILHLIFLANWG
ncbi:MAG: hypothetical protein H6937_03245 [Burkholderiales bacterium]|nr:hypothetical protein [Burkholderiales bacterium]